MMRLAPVFRIFGTAAQAQSVDLSIINTQPINGTDVA